jgi:hypothetical protein
MRGTGEVTVWFAHGSPGHVERDHSASSKFHDTWTYVQRLFDYFCCFASAVYCIMADERAPAGNGFQLIRDAEDTMDKLKSILSKGNDCNVAYLLLQLHAFMTVLATSVFTTSCARPRLLASPDDGSLLQAM